MGDTERFSKEELAGLIRRTFIDLGIDDELITIVVKDGPLVVLGGEVYSIADHRMAVQAVMDILGPDSVEDDMVVLHGADQERGEDEFCPADGLYDESEDYMGTDDIYRSIEDGIPYIPPDNPSYQRSSEAARWKKKKRKKG